MPSSDNPNMYNPEHEDPEAAREMFNDVKQKTALYGETLERKAKKGGSGNKMTVHAVEDPSMVIEDPSIQQVEMRHPEDGPLLKSMEVSNSEFPSHIKRRGSAAPNSSGRDIENTDGEHSFPDVIPSSTLIRETEDSIEPFASTKLGSRDEAPKKQTRSYNWLLIVGLFILAVFVYFYATRQVNIYEF